MRSLVARPCPHHTVGPRARRAAGKPAPPPQRSLRQRRPDSTICSRAHETRRPDAPDPGDRRVGHPGGRFGIAGITRRESAGDDRLRQQPLAGGGGPGPADGRVTDSRVLDRRPQSSRCHARSEWHVRKRCRVVARRPKDRVLPHRPGEETQSCGSLTRTEPMRGVCSRRSHWSHSPTATASRTSGPRPGRRAAT